MQTIPLLPSATGTQFCPKWGPNGDPILSQMGTYWGPSPAEMGTQKAYFWKLIEMSLFLEIQRKYSGLFKYKIQFHWQTGMIFIQTSFVITSIQMVNIWQWLLQLLASSSAWKVENGDLGKEMGTFWGPKNWKRSPWGPGSPKGDPFCNSGKMRPFV